MENMSLENLSPDTKKVFTELLNQKLDFLENFTLVGGSALAIRIGHRQSEDLDFFTYKDWFNKNEIFKTLSFFKDNKILLDSKEQVDLMCGGVKLSFTNVSSNPAWHFLKPELEQDNKIGLVNIATLDQSSAMKIHVLFLRSKFRDYYDNYVLSKYHIGLGKIYENAEKVIPGMTFRLFTTALTYVKDIQDENIDYLKPTYKVTKSEIQQFFEGQIKEYIKTEYLKDKSITEVQQEGNNQSQFSCYKSIYEESGPGATVMEIKNDKKDTGWIMHNKERIFTDKTRTEIEKAIKEQDRNKGIER
ncbi:MAG: nucleotidyl transferase AbiEii/AbiGii toxin family protein [Actinobacteria bacterium]|nr:nucleotidyl transferase AbiEii/AbiGii toxin family protein [Actinomycetota bacterium]MCL6104334.1 nucleotidyl transferase AbiEii/AbiGii toxin family protein [Actinomycetota bacterium]